MDNILHELNSILPEISLVLTAIFYQLFAVFLPAKDKLLMYLVSFTIVMIMFMLWHLPKQDVRYFNEMFSLSYDTYRFKMLVLLFTLGSIIIYINSCKISGDQFKHEFITLVLLSTVGIMVAISARNLLLLFCGIELQALCGYALAAINLKSWKSSEAGLKYFVLGALISAISLFGISFVYGFASSLQFKAISLALNFTGQFNIGLVIGLVLMMSSILFKLSVAPLHIWTPDVYEGGPTTSVNYFATVQKIGMLAVLLNILNFVIGEYRPISVDLIKIGAVLSMVIGALGAIRQTSIKRLMAYSTILNVGYALIGLVLHNKHGQEAAILYMLIYITGVTGFFACLVALLGENSEEVTFAEITGIAYHRKAIAGAIAIIMFSMIGLPPLAGFFGKYYILYNAIKEGQFALAITAIITSIIAAFYYLKIIKSVYFIEGTDDPKLIPTNNGLLVVTMLAVGFLLFFSIISM